MFQTTSYGWNMLKARIWSSRRAVVYALRVNWAEVHKKLILANKGMGQLRIIIIIHRQQGSSGMISRKGIFGMAAWL